MRSKLFVPCTRPELLGKALATNADALSFDLEDSVPSNSKADARDRLVQWLKSDEVLRSSKTIIVRVNGPKTDFFDSDARALAGLRVDLINIPKIDSPQEVCATAELLAQLDVSARMLINLETPAGIHRASEIAGAHPNVAGLQVGLNDLFAPLGIERRNLMHAHSIMLAIRLAAGASLFAVDGAWPDLDDEEGLRAEAVLARSLGFIGKSCIHPRQVPIVNEVFEDSVEVARARRLVKAAADAEASGQGAFLFEGSMADAPAIEAARVLLRRAGNK